MTYIALVILALIAVFIVGIYNGLVKLKNKANEAWADIDTQLKRRYDLIPNIVETVKGYAGHESQTLEKVIQARSAAMNAQSIGEKQEAENMLTGALKSIFALSENYPDLKANTNFLNLQNTLKEIEEHIQLSRRYYNATVRDFNTKLEVFPNNLIAGPLGFSKKEFFQAEDEEKNNVEVSFEKKSEPMPAAPEPTAPTAPAVPPTAPAVPPAAPPTPEVAPMPTEMPKPIEPAKPTEPTPPTTPTQ